MKILINLIKGIIITPIFLIMMFLGGFFFLLSFMVAVGEGDIYGASENIFGKITDWFYSTPGRLF